MSKFLKPVLLVAIVTIVTIVAIVLIGQRLKDQQHTYIDVLLAQQTCAVSKAVTVSDVAYRCHEGLDSEVTITIEATLTNDFDGDGKAETLVVWGEDFGGSGNFKYQGMFDGTDTMKSKTAIGDRVIINNVAVDSALILMDLTAHDQDDPLCCPTAKMIKRFQWNGKTHLLSEVVEK